MRSERKAELRITRRIRTGVLGRSSQLELLEDRILLAVSVPLVADPGEAQLALFAPGVTRFLLPQGAFAGTSQLYRFSGDSSAATYPVQFMLAPDHACAKPGGNGGPCANLDVAIGVYDASGNLIVSADAADGLPAIEELSAELQRQTTYLVGVFFDQAGPSRDFHFTVSMGDQAVHESIRTDPATGAATVIADGGETLFNSPADVDYYPIDMLNVGPSASVDINPLGPDVAAAFRVFRFDTSIEMWVPGHGDAMPGTIGDESPAMIDPPPGASTNDARYMLAVAPADFSSAAGAYQIDVTTPDPVLGPAIVPAAAISTDLLTLPPFVLGTAQAQVTGDLLTVDERFYRFRTPSQLKTGVGLDISVNTSMFAPVISLYVASGSELLDVASQIVEGPTTMEFRDVSAGTEYIVRVGAFDKGAVDAEAFELLISTQYEPLPLPMDPSVTVVSDLMIGPGSGAAIYRINPAADADVLAIELVSTNPNTPTSVAPALTLVGPTGTIVTSSVGVGQPLFVAVDVKGQGRPFDLYVAATSGTDTAQLRIATLTLDETLSFDPTQSADTNLASGDLATASTVNTFGATARVEYYQQITDPKDTTTISAVGTGGARPIVGYFNRVDGQFKLAGIALPDPNSTQVTTTTFLYGNDRHAIVAWNVGFDTSPGAQIQIQVDGPNPIPVEVGMVPDLKPDLPILAGTYQSILRIEEVTIEAEYERHFFKTILPNNMINLPLVSLIPNDPRNNFQAIITVFRDDGQGGLLEQPPLEQLANSPPGSVLSFFVDNGCPDQACRDQFIDSVRGRPLWFSIDPIQGQLGDGTYSLRMKVKTDEPFPYEVLEQAWRFPGSSSIITLNSGDTVAPNGTTNNNPNLKKWGGDCNPLNASQPAPTNPLPNNDTYAPFYGTLSGTVMPCVGTFPKSPVTGNPLRIVDIVQNQYGDGVATGSFNTTRPYTDALFGLGAIDVFRFWVTNPGPVSVRTVASSNAVNPNAAPVNTAMKLYQARFDANGQVDYLIEMPEVSGSRDWFGADRSRIDSQTYINDFDFFLKYDNGVGCAAGGCYGTGGGMYFAVVKNQEASLGSYRIEVDAPSFTLADTALIPPDTGGAVALDAMSAGDISGFLGYYPIQAPDYHDGTMTIDTPSVPFRGLWNFDLFDQAGRPIQGTESDQVVGDFKSGRTTATFSLPSGPQTVYLRVNEQTENPSPTSLVDVNINLVDFRAGFGPPADQLPVILLPNMLPTDPFGDGGVRDNLNEGQARSYAFQAPAGPLTVQVDPDIAGQMTLRWGVYADIDNDQVLELIAWDQTNGTFEPSTSVNLLLPEPRQPIRVREYAFDLEGFVGQSIAPYHDLVIVVEALSRQGSGEFTISVESNIPLPVCVDVNNGGFQRRVDDPVYAFTAYPDGEPLNRTASDDLQSPTLGLVECAPRRPMRDRNRQMNPLSPSSFVSIAGTTGFDWTTFTVPDHIDTTKPLKVQITPRTGVLFGVSKVEFQIYDRRGRLIAEGSGITALNSPITFDVPTGGAGQVSPGDVYYLRAGVSPNAYGTVDVSLTTALPKNAVRANRPPSRIDDFENNLSFYSRLQLGPDGKFQDGPVEALGNAVFWVGEAGIAKFDTGIRSADPGPAEWYVALYRGEDALASEFNIFKTRLNLVDFANESTKQDGLYSIDAYVEPGLYALVVSRTDGTSAFAATHTIDLPDVRPERVVIDPNFGDSYSLLRNFDLASEPALSNDRSIVEEYRTTYYRVTTPPGSLDGTIAFAYNLSCASPEVNDHALLSVWQQDQDTYTRYDSQTNRIDPPQPHPVNDPDCREGQEDSLFPSLAIVQPMVDGEPLRALPFDEFIVAFDRTDLATKVVFETHFEVPQSGIPDLVVESLNMLPNDGETKVVVSVRNVGYASSPLSDATLFFTGYPAPVQLNELPLGPFAARVRSMPWTPIEPEDHVAYVTDSSNEIDELFENNNSIDRQLLEVDAYRPTVEILLGTPSRDGHPGPEWGRYISKVPDVVSDIQFVVTDLDTPADTDLDGIDDHYLSIARFPNPEFYQGVELLLFGPESETVIEDYDLGMLFPTTPENSNQFTLQATDRYGLVSDLLVQTADVKPSLSWLTGEGSSITFNPQTNRYEIDFHNELINFPEDPSDQTLSGLLNFDVPFIGDKKNRFLVEIDSETTASLDPNQPVIAPVTARALLKILGQSVFDETYGSQQVSNTIQVKSDLVIDSQTLDVTHINAGVLFTDLDIFNWQSPEFTLFAFGVPDVASINANLQFGVNVGLNAGVAIALDPNLIQNVLFPPQPLGLTPKSFVQPNVGLNATVSGEIELLGIDLASLSGGVTFTLFVTYGLDTIDDTDVVPFDDFFNQSCFSIDGQLGLLFEADVLGIEVFEVEHFFPQFNIATAGCSNGILTQNGVVGSAVPAGAAAENPNGIQKQLVGNDPIGSLVIDPHPSLALVPKSGEGTYIQVVDADDDPALVRGNLAFAQRVDDAWTPLDDQTLAQPEHVANPALALTNDQPVGQPAVVVYQTAPQPDVSATTFNQFLTSQDIRSRYYNGTSWEAETTVAGGDGLFDYAPTVAFNDAGVGVSLWVRNQNSAPVNSDGQFDRSANEVMVSLWDADTHTWSAPALLTSNGTSDSLPAAYVDQQGVVYVVWLQDTANANQLMGARHDGNSWSAPVNLVTQGLPTDGRIKQVAIGSSTQGRIDVLIAHTVEPGPNDDPGSPVRSRLYNRQTQTANFLQPAFLEQVAENTNFYHLSTLQGADGLSVYWQQSDGTVDDIFITRRRDNGSWTRPAPLTSDDQIEFAPTIAFDNDGSYILAYEVRTAPIPPGSPVPAHAPQENGDDPAAPPTAGTAFSRAVARLPEVGYTRPAYFPFGTAAPVGSEATLQAELINRGFADTDVLVQYFVGQPNGNPVASETVSIVAGERHAISRPMEVIAGAQSYCILATPVNGQAAVEEAISSEDNLSCAENEGLPDLALTEATLSDDTPTAGDTVVVSVLVTNRSEQSTGPFDVSLYQGDPSIPSLPTKLVTTQTLPTLPGFESSKLEFKWTVPDSNDQDYTMTGGQSGVGRGLGHFILTAVVDPANSIAEALEGNNSQSGILNVIPDVAISGGPMALDASLIDHSGMDNVQIEFMITNQGAASASQVSVALEHFLENQPQGGLPAPIVISAMAAGETVPISFTVNGLAGLNRYRAVVTSDFDGNLSNNVGQTTLVVQGLPDLVPTNLVLSHDQPKQGDSLFIRSTIDNLGIAAADAIRVEVFAGAGEPANYGLLLGSTVIDRIDALGLAIAEVFIDTSLLEGQQNLCVVVDRPEHVFEQNDRNNTFCTLVEFGVEGQTQDVDTLSALIRGNRFDPAYDFDLDNDLDTDDLSFFVTDVLGTTFGDANLDRVFNSTDIVAVLQAGKFDDDIDNNTTWAEGDWNGDGDFNSGDLVAALQTGGFTVAATGTDMQRLFAAASFRTRLDTRVADLIFDDWDETQKRRQSEPMHDEFLDPLRATYLAEEVNLDR